MRQREKEKDEHCQIDTLTLSLSLPLSVLYSRGLFLSCLDRVLVPSMDERGKSARRDRTTGPTVFLLRAFIPTRIYLVALLRTYIPTRARSQI